MQIMQEDSDFPNVVSKIETQHPMGTNQKCKPSGPGPDLLNQKPQGGAEESVF